MICTDARLRLHRTAKLRSRRDAMLAALCGVCFPSLGGAAVTPGASQGAPRPEPRFEEVADGIFIRSGADEDATTANDDAIANVGFIVGAKAVATMDAGGSLA